VLDLEAVSSFIVLFFWFDVSMTQEKAKHFLPMMFFLSFFSPASFILAVAMYARHRARFG
jgi:hypothetical protein